MIHAVFRSIFQNGASNAHRFQHMEGGAFLRQPERLRPMLEARYGKRMKIAPLLIRILIKANQAGLLHMQAGKARSRQAWQNAAHCVAEILRHP